MSECRSRIPRSRWSVGRQQHDGLDARVCRAADGVARTIQSLHLARCGGSGVLDREPGCCGRLHGAHPAVRQHHSHLEADGLPRSFRRGGVCHGLRGGRDRGESSDGMGGLPSTSSVRLPRVRTFLACGTSALRTTLWGSPARRARWWPSRRTCPQRSGPRWRSAITEPRTSTAPSSRASRGVG